jgi:hypothetical protein
VLARAEQRLRAPHVIFPRTPVTIRQLGREPVVCDRNHVLFFNPGQRFFRSLRSRDGDRSYYVELAPELMFNLAALTSFPVRLRPLRSRPCSSSSGSRSGIWREPIPTASRGEASPRRSAWPSSARARSTACAQGERGRRAQRTARIVDQTKELSRRALPRAPGRLGEIPARLASRAST